MLLTITNTQPPATDLGYLLHKNPARCQTFELSFGKAHVFYPERSPDRCTVALLLDVDPIGLVRGRHKTSGEGLLDQYVNDRPYVASSLLSVALSRVFGSALAGRSDERPELSEAPLPLTAKLAAVPCRGGEGLLRHLYEPLGYAVNARRHPLDEHFPEWGDSAYFTVGLEAKVRLADLLTHLYVLVPVLDDDKHYWVGDAEVEKLLRHGAGWLSTHPAKELIAHRYLKHRHSLAREALARLSDEGESQDAAADETPGGDEIKIEEPIRLHVQRVEAIVDALKEVGAKTVVDLGCGEGRLLQALLKDRAFQRITGMDVSARALEIAHERLRFDRLPPRQQGRIQLIQGSLMYRDERIAGHDAAVVSEVVEHLDQARLAAVERVVFEFARPSTVVVTTPNAEYNPRFENLPAGRLRHKDHRFEWTRADFRAWAEDVAGRFGYGVRFAAIGPEDKALGAPTQMAVFSK